ncbi:mechanosensitive ion channel family protein [Lachnospiraceae bacterium HCP1S3_C3]|nr:mechanosensitive ion channel [Lachnospiraceae bacterium]MDD6858957.1 mechanosensitive ion channel [Lachnospiraceae bacterium]
MIPFFLLTETETEAATENVLMTAGEVADDINKKANAFVEYLKTHIDTFIAFGFRILFAILMIIVGKIIIKFLLKICDRFFDRAGTEISVRKFLNSFIRVVLYIVLILVVCAQVGIETTSFIAVMGSAGLALGLSLQGSLSNFAGGILILLIKPFVVGDYIIDGGSGKEGKVSRIDLFYTHLITPDNKMIVIPNGTLANSNLTNLTTFDKRRVDIMVGISYSSDIKKAKELLEEIADKCQYVLKEEKVEVFVNSLDSSQVTLGIRVWTKTTDYWDALFQLNETIKYTFDENDIEIPFDQLEVHVKK